MAKKYYLTKLEKETGICFNEEESRAIVYSANYNIKKKLDKFCELYPKDFRCVDFGTDNDGIKCYHIPKKRITISAPRKKKKQPVKATKKHSVKEV